MIDNPHALLSDWDNYAKTVCDALGVSRVIWNDKLIAYGSCSRFENMPEELIAFSLKLLSPKEEIKELNQTINKP